jgi:hypothetical protein
VFDLENFYSNMKIGVDPYEGYTFDEWLAANPIPEKWVVATGARYNVLRTVRTGTNVAFACALADLCCAVLFGWAVGVADGNVGWSVMRRILRPRVHVGDSACAGTAHPTCGRPLPSPPPSPSCQNQP